MKPRQQSAPATIEDLDVWLWLMRRWRARYGDRAMARFDLNVYSGDRRDAAIMLQAKLEMSWTWVRLWGDTEYIESEQVAWIRGQPGRLVYVDGQPYRYITYFA